MVCPACGHHNAPGSHSCSNCGNALVDRWGDPLVVAPAVVPQAPTRPLAARGRSPVLLAALAVVLLAAGGVAYGLFAGGQESTAESDSPVATAGGSGGSCSAVERPELQTATHIEEGATHKPYSSDPPTSGAHYAVPADPGFFATPLAPEQLVHNLEHGQIVIWYRLDLTPEEVESLASLTSEEPVATITVPYAGLTAADKLVMTAWGALQRCTGVSTEDIDAFRAEFQGRGPENVGVPVFEGAF